MKGMFFFFCWGWLPGLWGAAITGDSYIEEQKTICAKDTNNHWDSALNRCVTPKEVVDVRTDHEKCVDIKEEKDRKQCMLDLANKGTSDDRELPERSGLERAETILAAYNVAQMVISAMGSGVKSDCLSPSIFRIASLTSLAANIYLTFFTENKIKKLQENYAKEALDTNPYEAQNRAFDYLIEEQKAIIDYAEKKRSVHQVVALAYTASAGFGMYEWLFSKKSCQSSDDGGKGACSAQQKVGLHEVPQSIEDTDQWRQLAQLKNVDDVVIFNRLYWLLPMAAADTKKDFLIDVGVGAGVSLAMNFLLCSHAGSVGGSVTKFFNSPMGVAILSSVAAFIHYRLYKEYEEVIKVAKENIKILEETKSKFKTAITYLCPKGHDDLRDPYCYCYTASGQKDSEKTNSETCQSLWAQMKGDGFLESNQYGVDGKLTEPNYQNSMGCLTYLGQYDPMCSCEQVVDKSSGQNACMKSNMGNYSMDMIPNATSLDALGKALDAMNTGKLAAKSLNSGKLQQYAARLEKQNAQLLEQVNKDLIKNKKSPVVFSEQRATRLASTLAPPASGISLSPLAAPNYASLSGDMSAAKVAAVNKALNTAGLTLGANAAEQQSEKKKFAFNFADDRGQNVSTKHFMERDYKMDSGEISNNPEASLWEIISLRYLNSGLERLFSTESGP